MRLPPRLFGAAFLTMTSLLAVPVLGADALRVDGLKYSDEVTVIGIHNGQLQALIKGNDKQFDFSKVEWINLANQPNFNKAEDGRKDAKAAAALYKSSINNINDRKLKVLAQLRSVGPLDADGKWSDAVANFVDAYQASPTDAIWKLRPTNMPAAGSNMLKESADRIEAKVASFSSADAKKNLKNWELELLNKANDPRAGNLARELGVAGPAEAAPAQAQAAAPVTAAVPAGPGLEGVDSAVKGKNYDAAISQADKMLLAATGDTAIRLFELKAQALEGKQDFPGAAATYLRIPAHYPGSQQAPSALLRAAEIQKQLKHDDQAKRLYKEILDLYPNSVAAVKAKGQG